MEGEKEAGPSSGDRTEREGSGSGRISREDDAGALDTRFYVPMPSEDA